MLVQIESWLFHCHTVTLYQLFTHVCLYKMQHKLNLHCPSVAMLLFWEGNCSKKQWLSSGRFRTNVICRFASYLPEPSEMSTDLYSS